MTKLLALGAKADVLRVLRYQTIQNVVISLLRSISFGSDAFALKAEAYHSPEKAFPIFECSIVGRGEGYITGVVAAKVASLIYKSPVLPGVFHLEQIVNPVTFVNEMEQEGLKYYESIMLDKKRNLLSKPHTIVWTIICIVMVLAYVSQVVLLVFLCAD